MVLIWNLHLRNGRPQTLDLDTTWRIKKKQGNNLSLKGTTMQQQESESVATEREWRFSS